MVDPLSRHSGCALTKESLLPGLQIVSRILLLTTAARKLRCRVNGVACWHLPVDLCDCPLPLFPTSARIPTSALRSENSGNLKLVLNTQGSFIPPFPVEGQPSITAWTRSLHGL